MKIGIIGSGGAGMCAAWLLDPEHTVTLIEKKDYIGGNTHTVIVDTNGIKTYVDDGAAWFSPAIYPYFNKYIDMAGVQYDWIPLTMTYFDILRNQATLLPPATWRSIIKIFTTTHVLPELIALLKLLLAASPLVKAKKSDLSYKEFIGHTGISQDMADKFIKPLLSGLWGCPWHQIDRFSIYPLMKYIVSDQPAPFQDFKMKTMVGGTGQYIQTIAGQLKNTDIQIQQEVISIEPDLQTNQVTVRTGNGMEYKFDHLIITAGAHDAHKICNAPSLAKAKNILGSFEYYQATLATHSDISFMPSDRRDWSIVNVMNNGSVSEATIWHGQKTGADVFCSYIINKEHTPQNIYHTSEWWLPMETPAFFHVQKTLSTCQGQDNIWFAGDYTRDTGSHEDAIQSAVKAVQNINPQNARLSLLKAGLPEVQ
jgi:predicted NAD/FAD-binding protein